MTVSEKIKTIHNKNEENNACDIYYLDTQTAKILALSPGSIS